MTFSAVAFTIMTIVIAKTERRVVGTVGFQFFSMANIVMTVNAPALKLAVYYPVKIKIFIFKKYVIVIQHLFI